MWLVKYIEPQSDSNKLLRYVGVEIGKNLRFIQLLITSGKSINRTKKFTLYKVVAALCKRYCYTFLVAHRI